MREIKFRAWDLVNVVEDVSIDGKYWFKENNGQRGGYYDVQVYPLMQYTGLKDKNDKEIYEGDILTNNQVVEFLEDLGGWYAMPYRMRLDRYWLKEEGGGMEVIGNIYENPELLEKK